MRLSTGLFVGGGLLYLIGLYGFTTHLPGYSESIPAEIEASLKERPYMDAEMKAEAEWKIRSTHAQWESILYPAFMACLGLGMIVTGAGAWVYLRSRRQSTESSRPAS